jgi:hypothetical protein
MKAKLIKTDSDSYHNGHYFLNNEEGFAIGSTDYEWCRRVASVKPQYKLSKENCDEIFGVVDVEKLAEKEYPTFNLELNLTTSFNTLAQAPFIKGFNKAMELNKDKLFTEQDITNAMNRVWDWCEDEKDKDCSSMTELREKHIQSIQQPTEIDVEMVMRPASLVYKSNLVIEELDSNGNLILRKL